MRLVKYISNVDNFCSVLRNIRFESCGCKRCFNYSFDMQERLADIIFEQPSLAQLDCGYSLLCCKTYSGDKPILLIGNTLINYGSLSSDIIDNEKALCRNNTLIDNTELLWQVARGLQYKGNDILGKLGINESNKYLIEELEAGFGEAWRYYAISAENGIGTVEDCPWLRIIVTTQDNSKILHDIIDPIIIGRVYKEYDTALFKVMSGVINEQLKVKSGDRLSFRYEKNIKNTVKASTDDKELSSRNNGKDKCNILKSIRGKLGDKLGISINTKECTYGGNCKGTCPACDAEAAKISAELLRSSSDGFNDTQTSIDKTESGKAFTGKVIGNTDEPFDFGETTGDIGDPFDTTGDIGNANEPFDFGETTGDIGDPFDNDEITGDTQ